MKKAILKHFVIFTGKHLCWGIFINKVSGHQAYNFIKETPTDIFLQILRNL